MHARMPRRLLFYSNDTCNAQADFCSATTVSAPRPVFALVGMILRFCNAIPVREPRRRKMRFANISQLRYTYVVSRLERSISLRGSKVVRTFYFQSVACQLSKSMSMSVIYGLKQKRRTNSTRSRIFYHCEITTKFPAKFSTYIQYECLEYNIFRCNVSMPTVNLQTLIIRHYYLQSINWIIILALLNK